MPNRLEPRFLVFFLVFVLSLGAQEVGKGDANDKENKEPAAMARYFYKFPPHIQSVLTDSIVGVEVSLQSAENGTIKSKTKSATGFLVGRNTVLTSLHTFSDMPAAWPSATVRVYDGRNFFEVVKMSVKLSVDLALLVIARENGGAKFSKKPVRLADFADKQKIPSHFYTFAFSVTGENVYFPMELGRYLMETNLIGNETLPESFGVINGNTERGFSGAPLIGSDGKVYGVLSRRSDAYIYVTTLEQIGSFLKESADKFDEEAAKEPSR